MKKIARFTISLLLLAFLCYFPWNIYSENQSKKLIYNMAEAVNTQDWKAFKNYWYSPLKEEFEEMMAAEDPKVSTRGIFTVTSEQILYLKKLNPKQRKMNSLIEDFGRNIGVDDSKIDVYLAAIDFRVKSVTPYFYNGANFYIIGIIKENGIKRLLFMSEANMETIDSIDIKKYALDEAYNQMLRVRTARTQNIIADGDGTYIGPSN